MKRTILNFMHRQVYGCFRVCEELLVDFHSLGGNPVSMAEDCQPYRPGGSLVDTEIEICPEEEHERVIPHDEAMETEGATTEEGSNTENEHTDVMVIQVNRYLLMKIRLSWIKFKSRACLGG